MNAAIDAVLRYRWLTLLITLLLMIGAVAGLPRIIILSDYKAFVDPNYPGLKRLEAIEAIFTENQNLLIAIAPEHGTVFTAETLGLIEQLTEQAWQLPHASRVDSITNYQHTEAIGDDLSVGNLLPEGQPINQATVEKVRRVALQSPDLMGVLVGSSEKVAVVSLTFEIPEHIGSAAAQHEIIEALNPLIDDYRLRYPQVRFEITGMVAVNDALGRYAKQDSLSLIPAMLGLMAIVLWLVTRSLAAILAASAVVIGTGLGTMGLLGWFNWVIDSASAISPVVIMTLAVADSIHVIEGMQKAMRAGAERIEALKISLRDNLLPVFLTSLTTILGVITFAFADFPSLRRLGISVAVGVTIALILSLTVLPAILSLLPMKVRQQTPSRIYPLIAEFTIRQYRKILTVAALIVAVLLPLIPLNSFNDSANTMLSSFTPERKAVDFYEDNVSGIIQIEIAIFTGQANGIANPEFLRTVDQFAQWLRKNPDVDHVTSLTDTFKRLNKNMHGDDPGWYKLPEKQDLASQYLLLYEMSLPYGLDLNNQLNIDKSAVRLAAIFNRGDSQRVVEAKWGIEQWFRSHAPQLSVEVTGTTMLMGELSYLHFIPSMVKGASIAILMVSLVLFFALRSFRLGLLGMLANILPVAVGYGLWYLMNGHVSFAVASVAGVCLGVVVDFAVHWLSRYRLGLTQTNDTTQAIHYAFAKAGRALTTTMAVLVAGFWLLTLSPVSLNADMGKLTGIVIIIALSFDFFVLPALLIMMSRWPTKRAISS